MNYYLKVFQNYANFSGRARRSEYWFFVLFNMLVIMGLSFTEGLMGSTSFTLTSIYYLGMIIPSIAVAARRMHDVGKSGWYMLIPIYSLILALTDGDIGENYYGSDPKSPNLEGQGYRVE